MGDYTPPNIFGTKKPEPKPVKVEKAVKKVVKKAK